mgnify:CR=1 FL=1
MDQIFSYSTDAKILNISCHSVLQYPGACEPLDSDLTGGSGLHKGIHNVVEKWVLGIKIFLLLGKIHCGSSK